MVILKFCTIKRLQILKYKPPGLAKNEVPKKLHEIHLKIITRSLIHHQFSFQQYLSEKPSSSAPTIEDLGVKPLKIDDAAIAMLRRHRDMYTFEEARMDEEVCKPTSAYA